MQNFGHQDRAINRFKDRPYGALFMEMGTGKSRIGIKLAEHKYATGASRVTLIVTTVGLLGNWFYNELPKHSELPYTTWVWNKDTKFPEQSGHIYFLVNIDAIITPRFQTFYKTFLKAFPRFTLIVDESSKAKNPKAERTKKLIMIARKASSRFIMSGTPTPNSPLDVYSQADILAPGLLGFTSMYAFKGRYAVIKLERNGPRVYEKISGYQNIEELTAKIHTFAEVVKKADCLDLPPKIYRKLDVPLSKEQLKHYNNLKNIAMTYIESEQITVANTVSLINRLLQICSGQLKSGTDYYSIGTDRLTVLKELVEAANTKTLIWTSYVNNAKDIAEHLGDSVLLLPSGLPISERQRRIELFKSGPALGLVANPASAGHGITLIESANSIYYSNSFNYENRAQSEDRNHRIGQTSSVLYTDLVALGTVEERVIDILKSKQKLSDELLVSTEYLRELFK